MEKSKDKDKNNKNKNNNDGKNKSTGMANKADSKQSGTSKDNYSSHNPDTVR